MLTPHWLWGSRSAAARVARCALLPGSLAWAAASRVREHAYATGILATHSMTIPVVSVGNLTVGGSGKTPLAGFVARHYGHRGLQPAIVLRGYGGDEGQEHRRALEDAIVVEGADRPRAAEQAVAAGADVIILDDGFQRLDLARDLDVLLVSAESDLAAPWTLPAGPWREGRAAAERADFVIVTRKRAPRSFAEACLDRIRRRGGQTPAGIARLGVTGFRGMHSGEAMGVERIEGSRVLIAAGIADPRSLVVQCRELGADVTNVPLADHQRFRPGIVNRLLHAGRRVDYVVVTEKDAVKLRPVWPLDGPEPLVAQLDVAWDFGLDDFEDALDATVTPATRTLNPYAHQSLE